MKKKILKIVIIIFFIIILILAALILWRYNILLQMNERHKASFSKSNYYYHSEVDNQIFECWKKDGVYKVHIIQKDGKGDITFWTNKNTDENLTLYNIQKQYTTNGVVMEAAPASLIITTEDKKNIFSMAINPKLYINYKKYEDKTCYHIKLDGDEEIIEKETGLILYNKYGYGERKLKYSFDTVTDEDIAKPDISEYTLYTPTEE